MWRCLLAVLCLIPASWAFSCGSSAIPFRLEVLRDGSPILGCATPSCFGGGEGGVGFDAETQANAAVEGRDGIQREQDLEQNRWRHSNAEAQRAECFLSSAGSCPENHWVGGLSGGRSNLQIQCCKYKGLAFSKILTRSVIHPGEVFTGGEVLLNDRQTQFDLISDVRKLIAADGRISYNFTVTRMHCIPDAPEKINNVRASADDIVAVLSGQANPVGQEEPRRQAESGSQGLEPLSGGAKAFQGNIPQQFSNGQPQLVGQQQAPVQLQGQLRGGGGRLVGYVTQQPTGYQQPRVIGYQPVQPQYVAGRPAVAGYAGGGYGGGSGAQSYLPLCFTGDSLVDTEYGKKRMDELKIGDRVMAVEYNQTTYVPIVSFMHRLPNKVGRFHRIETADGQVIKMTDKHFIYVIKCDDPYQRRRLVYAQDVTTNDCVHRVSSDNQGFVATPVVSNTIFTETGIFAPMTSTGDIVVDNVLASCHSIVHGQSLVQTFFEGASYWADWTKWAFGQQDEVTDEDAVTLSPAVDFLITVLDLVVPKSLLMSH